MSNYSLLTSKNGIKWDVSANNVTLVSLNGSGTASGQYLKSNGTNAPSWAPISGGSQSLASVMNIGNMASQNLDMSSNSITNVPNINSPSNTNLTIGSNYTSASGTGQVLIQNTATATAGPRSSQLILLSGSAGSGTIEPQAQLICTPPTAGYPAPCIQLTAGPPDVNTRGVIITNNYFSSVLPEQTNTINCSNSAIEITSDLLGDYGQFLQMSLSNLQFSMINASHYLFQIVDNLFTFNGNLTFGLSSNNLQTGLLERAVINGTTTGRTTLGFDDCFLTIIVTPTGSRSFVIPTPSLPVVYSGYWIAICNRSKTETVNVDIEIDPGPPKVYKTIYTIPLNPSADNFSGGSTARFAVSPTGLSWFRVS